MTVTFVFEMYDEPLDESWRCTVPLTGSLVSAFRWASTLFCCRHLGDAYVSTTWFYEHHCKRVWISLRQSERQPLDLILYESYL